MFLCGQVPAPRPAPLGLVACCHLATLRPLQGWRSQALNSSLFSQLPLVKNLDSIRRAAGPRGMGLGHPCSLTSPLSLYNMTSLWSRNIPAHSHLRAFANLCLTYLPPFGIHVLAKMSHLSKEDLHNFSSSHFTIFVVLATLRNCLICLSSFFVFSFYHFP